MAVCAVLGWILVILGLFAIVIGLIFATVISIQGIAHKLSGPLRSAIDNKEVTLAKVILEFLKEMLKRPGGIFFAVGLLLLGGGLWLLVYRPF